MSDAPKTAQAVDTILYTTESAASRRRAEDDLKVDDPDRERAVAAIAANQTAAKTPQENKGEPSNR